MAKYIFITGGVVSSLGKGITAASIGRLLIDRGLRIKMLKIDPYLNVDPGTMSPYQHGEVYVTEDGAETDLDLGHYERFTGTPTSKKSNITAGRIYWQVLTKERRGDYLGRTVQMIPHLTDEIKTAIQSLDDDTADVILCEIGGTVGDIEGLIFMEALRQIRQEVKPRNAMFIHLTYVPYIKAAKEIKTKPSQQSVAKLREIGIIPDVLICRTEVELNDEVRQKLALFCNVPIEAVLEEKDVERTIYEVPMVLHKQGLDQLIVDHFDLLAPACDLRHWKKLIENVCSPKGTVRIGVVGKYAELHDAYKSIFEAIEHGGIAHHYKVELCKIAAEDIESCVGLERLDEVDGLLVPGGFGHRGVEGKIKIANYAREKKIPFFGICLGLQCAVIDYARSCCGLTKANSLEFDEHNAQPVVALMEDQKKVKNLGGTMRLGNWDCHLEEGSRAAEAYGCCDIKERHRHRYEVNNQYRPALEEAGLIISGTNPDTGLVEVVELADHPWYVAVQFHPELRSQPLQPHPLFSAFIGAAIKSKEN